ncbi:MAG: sigma factor-like helix-turn-helix DNA-binding protein [Patescibacteria group bacterium]|nr:sigma factor-like helix-turn-helix DNA-binding protein [Patescibacteria group bacterium]
MTENKKEKLSQIKWEEIVTNLLSLIKTREAEILRLRFGLDGEEQTLESIGQKMGLTRERVRQIENNARANVIKHKDFQGLIDPVKDVMVSALEEQGGVSSRDRVARSVILEEEINKNRKFLEFLIDNFVDEIKDIKHEHFLDGWYLNEENLSLAAGLIEETKKLVAERNKLMMEEDLLKEMTKLPSYANNKEKIDALVEKNQGDLNKVFLSYLDLARGLDKTPFQQWGLTDWRHVRPRRVNDKIYLILDWYKKPMHFREIAQKINEVYKNDKPSHPATVHNDLISDERFVLIGRGVYALKEWGYEGGTVADIVERVLNEKGPLSREEVITEVLKQRDVKTNTILLALSDKEAFEKVEGKYRIKK